LRYSRDGFPEGISEARACGKAIRYSDADHGLRWGFAGLPEARARQCWRRPFYFLPDTDSLAHSPARGRANEQVGLGRYSHPFGPRYSFVDEWCKNCAQRRRLPERRSGRDDAFHGFGDAACCGRGYSHVNARRRCGREANCAALVADVFWFVHCVGFLLFWRKQPSSETPFFGGTGPPLARAFVYYRFVSGFYSPSPNFAGFFGAADLDYEDVSSKGNRTGCKQGLKTGAGERT